MDERKKKRKLKQNSLATILRTNKYCIWYQLNTNVFCFIRTVLLLTGIERGPIYAKALKAGHQKPMVFQKLPVPIPHPNLLN